MPVRSVRSAVSGRRPEGPADHTAARDCDGGSDVSDSLGTILTAMVTPFDAAEAVDHDAPRAARRHLLANGSDGLVVAGTTGESPTLSDDEKLEMFRTVVRAVGGRAPVVAGTGSNDTRHSVELTQGRRGVRRGRRARRGALLQQAARARRARALPRRRRGHQPAGDRLQHPRALRHQRLAGGAGRARARSRTSSPSSRRTPTSPRPTG